MCLRNRWSIIGLLFIFRSFHETEKTFLDPFWFLLWAPCQYFLAFSWTTISPLLLSFVDAKSILKIELKNNFKSWTGKTWRKTFALRRENSIIIMTPKTSSRDSQCEFMPCWNVFRFTLLLFLMILLVLRLPLFYNDVNIDITWKLNRTFFLSWNFILIHFCIKFFFFFAIYRTSTSTCSPARCATTQSNNESNERPRSRHRQRSRHGFWAFMPRADSIGKCLHPKRQSQWVEERLINLFPLSYFSAELLFSEDETGRKRKIN